jgi:DNA-directed RNA polymerase specialized sigma subunit
LLEQIAEEARDKDSGGKMSDRKSDPVSALLEEKTATQQGRQAKELELWKVWRKSKSPDDLEPLLDAYKPLIDRKAVEYGAGAVLIPPVALKGEITKHIIGAFETYDPNRGAALNTHVQHRIQKAKRFVAQHQNVAYLPETLTYRIGDINRATDALTEDLGRSPIPQEIADHLKMPVRTVIRLQKTQFRDVPASMAPVTDEGDVSMRLGPREDEVLSLLPSILTPDESLVFSHIYHPNPAQRITSTTELAKKLQKNPSQVSRLKTSILNKAKSYI